MTLKLFYINLKNVFIIIVILRLLIDQLLYQMNQMGTKQLLLTIIREFFFD